MEQHLTATTTATAMRKQILTGKELALEFNSKVLTFSEKILTFFLKGITHYDAEAFTYNESDMGEATITLDLLVPPDENPAFSREWYVDFRGERFYNKTLQPSAVKDTASLQYKYSLVFESQRVDLKRYEFANFVTALDAPQPVSYDFTLALSVSDFVDRFNINLAYYFGADWSMVLDDDWIDNLNTLIYDGTSALTIAFSRQTLWSMLTQVYDTFGLRWGFSVVDGVKTVTIGATPTMLSHVFEYGSGNGLTSIERVNPMTEIYTRLSGRGASRNLPFRYFDSSTADLIEDPDNNEYTRLIPYTNILPTTYRDYVKGWNDGSASASMDASTYGYLQGYYDASSGAVFNPIDFAVSETESKWGVRKGSLEDSEDIYPTIQNASISGYGRIDEVLAVEAVLNDNYDTSTQESQVVAAGLVSQKLATVNTLYSWPVTSYEFVTTEDKRTVSFDILQSVLSGNMAKLDFQSEITVNLMLGDTIVDYTIISRGSNIGVSDPSQFSQNVTFTDVSPGTYYLSITVEFINTPTDAAGLKHLIATGMSEISIIQSDEYKYKPTFDIWIKNIWDSSIGEGEALSEYVHRIWDPLISPSGEMTVSFSDGMLAGEDYDFLVAKIDGSPDYLIEYNTDVSVGGHRSHWKLTLIKSDAELEASDLYLPNEAQNAVAGNHFFFTNIELPYYPYVYAAEQRVQDYIESELAKVDDEYPTYAIDASAIFLEAFAEQDDVRVGNVVQLLDAQILGVSAHQFFVNSLSIEYSKNKFLPKWSISVSEKPIATANSISVLQGSVKVLSSSIRSAEETMMAVDAILQKSYLKRDGSEQYSLSPTRFARKITSDEGVFSDDYQQGSPLGSGFGLYKDQDGAWALEVDKLRIRKTLEATELVINQVSIYGGKHMYTAAAMTVSAVEVSGDAFTCYMDLKQGTVINQFVVDDLAFCQRFDPESNSVIKYYWGRVMSVGPDYIEIDRTDIDGDGYPAVGDNVAQLGHKSNINRQAAYVIDQLNGGQCTQYAGISDTSLASKDQVSFGFDPSTGRAYQRTYGDFYAGNRNSTTGNYLRFDSSTGELSYKGVIRQDSTVVDAGGNSSLITVDRGAFGIDVTYFPGNTATYNGTTYYCDVQTVGNLPTDASYWHVWAKKGESGASIRITRNIATDSELPTLWDPSTAYPTGVEVVYSGLLYICNTANTGEIPLDNLYYWFKVGNLETGDQYTVEINDGWLMNDDGHLWVWTGASWSDAGLIRGDEGKGIASVSMYYLASDASTGVDISTAGWTDTIQTVTVTNKYLWTYQKIIYTDSSVRNSTPCISGVFGTSAYEPRLSQQFVSLLADAGGGLLTGELAKAFFTISVYRDGVLLNQQNDWDIRSMSDSSTGFSYSLYGDTITIETIDAALDSGYIDVVLFDTNTDFDFAYLRISFAKSKQGYTGVGIDSVTEYYLATDASTGVTIGTSGWTESMQPVTVSDKYLWNYEKVVYTDDTSINSTPILIGAYGDTGIGISSIVEYYLATGSTDVSIGTEGWTEEVQDITPTDKYLWNYEKTIFTDDSYITTVPAIIGAYGNTGADGSSGTNGADGVVLICDKQALAATPTGNTFTEAVTVRLMKGSALVPVSEWTSRGKTLTSLTAGADSSTANSYTVNLTAFSASTITLGYVLITVVYAGTTFTLSVSVARVFNPINVAKGAWASGEDYTGTCIQRDVVKDSTNGSYYALRPTVGTLTSSTAPHSDLTNWEALNSWKNVATETLLAENANIAGFIYKSEKMTSQTLDASLNPMLTIDGIKGEIIAKMGTFGNMAIFANSLQSENMEFTEGSIEDLATLITTIESSIGYQASWDDVSTANRLSAHAYTQPITITATSSLKFKADASTSQQAGAAWAEIRDSDDVIVWTQDINTGLQESISTIIPAGTYTIHLFVTNDQGGDMVIELTLDGYSSDSIISASSYFTKNKTGKDGIYSFWDDTHYLYYKSTYGFEVRVGDFGMRVRSTGFSKMTSGIWTAWTP